MAQDDEQYEYELQGMYGADFERVTTEQTREDAQQMLADYQRNEPGTTFRIKLVRAGGPVGTGTYRIVRFFRDDDHDKETIKTGLSLEQAQAHCQDPTTRREGEWFDGYEQETTND